MSETSGGPNAGGSLGELLRLQAEFQGRLAEETLRYLRRMQGMFEPHAPGTVIQPERPEPLRATGSPGGRGSWTLEAENRQRVHTVLAPALTPLVADDGTTWVPEAEVVPSVGLLAPEETVRVTVVASVPAHLPVGDYRGLLVLRGLRSGGVPVVMTVSEEQAS
jgi:hypothetical protein